MGWRTRRLPATVRAGRPVCRLFCLTLQRSGLWSCSRQMQKTYHMTVEPVDHGVWTEDAAMGEDKTMDENRRWLYEGVVTPALRARLQYFTEPGPVARHVLNRKCASCGSCKLCMEGSPHYLQKLAVRCFKQTIVRHPVDDLPSKGVHPMARYAYNVMYVPDLSADPLPVN